MIVERVRVGEVLRLERVPVEPDPTLEYVTVGIRSFGKGFFRYEPKLGDKLGSLRFFEVQANRLVVSNIKGWEGAIAVSSEQDAGYLASNRFLSYKPVGGRIDVGWARWYFLSEAGIRKIQRASPGSADRNRTLSIDRFEALEIPLPPIEEQRRLTRYLDASSCKADSVGEYLRYADADTMTAMLPGLIDTIIERESVARANVADLVEFVSDTVHPGDDPAPADSFVGLQHIESHTGRRLGDDPLGLAKGRKFRFRPGDVVYGYLRPYLNKVWVADRHGLCSVDQYVLRPCPGVSADLLAYSLRGQKMLSRTIELTHNLQLPRLRSGLLASLPVPTVREGHHRLLVAQLDQLRDRVVDLAAKRRHQDQLISALLPSAMNEAFADLS